VLVFCALPTFLVGSFLVGMMADPRACKSPQNEPTLITAYLAEPLLTAGSPPPTEEPAVQSVPDLSPGASQSSDQPDIHHFCDLVGVDPIHPLGFTEVTYRYPASAWHPVPDLLDLYQSSAAAEGWVYSSNRNDNNIAAIEFCRAVRGINSTLTVALMRGDGAGAPIIEARQIVSVPSDGYCPFQSLW
jgi:hypothetical protein